MFDFVFGFKNMSLCPFKCYVLCVVALLFFVVVLLVALFVRGVVVLSRVVLCECFKLLCSVMCLCVFVLSLCVALCVCCFVMVVVAL